MGNKPIETVEEVERSSFDFLSVIGKGGFGKVWKVRYKKNFQEFAMKEMSKALVIEKNCLSSILYERDLLSNFRHPFIINSLNFRII
jgi:serine/threonine protein kinase